MIHIHKEFVFDHSPHFSQCHASTIAYLPSGHYMAAWFGGTREGAADVAIWTSIRRGSGWSEPVEVARHLDTPTWNPVLFPIPSTPIVHLFYRAGQSPYDWVTYTMTSNDEGISWSAPKAMPDGILGPIKNKPIVLNDDTWLAGSSVETKDDWYAVIERSTDQGLNWRRSEKIAFPNHPRGIIQPTLWESDPNHVHALLRTRGLGRIARSDSTDGGRTWSTPYLVDLPHNNSGIDLTVIRQTEGVNTNNVLALLYNPVATSDRTPLQLSFSYDNGQTWPKHVTIEDSPGEYSYPAIIATPTGLALTYTYNRKTIAFALIQM